jgi:hypothetical protein
MSFTFLIKSSCSTGFLIKSSAFTQAVVVMGLQGGNGDSTNLKYFSGKTAVTAVTAKVT